MAVSVTHAFVSPVADQGNPNEVGPNEWNDAHTVLGLGTAAEADSTDFATAAQGALADSALQAADIADMLETSDIGVTVQAHSAVLDATTASFTTAQETKLGHISVTQAVDLDAIETRVNALDAAVVLKGSWDASAGTFPGGGTAQAGDSYIVSVAGTVNSVAFALNDRIIAITDNASTTVFAANWFKADYTDQVLSVDGQTGAVSLSAVYQPLDSDLTAIAALSTQTFGRARLTDVAAEDARNALDTAAYVATRTALKALDPTKDTVAVLTEAGREGLFLWYAGDYSTQITADTQEGIYVKATAIASTSGSWVRVYTGAASVKWFGATGDGTTDDATAIQKAIDLVRDIWFPQATYAVGTRLQVGNGTSSAVSTKNGYNLRGSTAGTTSVETGPVLQPTRLKWIGSTFNSILRIDGPMVGCNINGLVFDCNNIAGSNGIHTRHMMLSTWQDVVVTNNTGTGIIHESYPSFAGSVQGANKNTFTNVRVVGCGAQGSGIRIGNTAGTSGDVLDVAQNVWINCHFERDGTHAPAFSIWLGFTDNITFIETVVTASGGSLGVGVYIQEPTGGTLNTFPDEVLFLNCPILDGFVASGTWTPSGGVICYPYPTGDGEPIPTSDYIRGSTFTHTFFNGLRLGAGKATVAPLKFTSGTLETTAEAGAVEYDGKAFYATSVASSRQVISAKQIATVQGSAVALTNNIATAQSIFAAANDTLTVAAATTYRFRAVLKFNTGATSHTTAFGFGGTATFTSCNYSSRATSSAANTLATTQQRRVAAATASVLTAASTAVTTDIEIEGMIRINGAGTIIPQVTFSAGPTGTCETAIDSFFELEPIGSNTVAAVGNWA
jgi:hypothetical protein